MIAISFNNELEASNFMNVAMATIAKRNKRREGNESFNILLKIINDVTVLF